MPVGRDVGADATPRIELGELAERVRRLEDQVALYQVMAAYGPAVDSGNSAGAASLWSDDGLFDVSDGVSWRGRGSLEEVFDGDRHRAIIAGGAAHLMSMPLLEIDGDTAIGTGYAQLVCWDGATERFDAVRVMATRWEFARGADGWRVLRRTNRLLDGGEAARALLGRAVPSDAGRNDATPR